MVIVGGALQGRASYRPLAEVLAARFTVFNYDRRGRGDSGDTAPYSVEREVEDLAAVIAAAGGFASVYGHSSGAGLVLHAAERGLPIDKIVLHELPFDPDEDDRATREEAEKYRLLLDEGRRGDAVELFLASAGMPPEIVAHVRNDPAMVANAPTLLYDPFEVMSTESRGCRTPVEQADAVTNPALVLAGTESPPWMVNTARELANALTQGKLHVMEGQGHVVPPELLSPVLTEFLAT
ncbi:alpha/beta fold hydrolase [Actinophytocola sp. S1-96]|uniref:Alpha/beta fold hydrolase n=1 Tax=Actinophytocola gossypii TaxID=2812003 RepID=A0ABT2JJB7_9PSEU|nr:alpha/beta fold hydrolase [Actinophytocola gossypii]